MSGLNRPAAEKIGERTVRLGSTNVREFKSANSYGRRERHCACFHRDSNSLRYRRRCTHGSLGWPSLRNVPQRTAKVLSIPAGMRIPGGIWRTLLRNRVYQMPNTFQLDRAPASRHQPPAHGSHAARPLTAAKLPLGQEKQALSLACPSNKLYFPIAHGTHVELLVAPRAPLNDPAAHGVHSMRAPLSVVQYPPSLHGIHSV
eukprot:6443796-Prymnesium_polylepis.2